MEKFEQTNQPDIECLKVVAKELNDLQSKENDGRGVSCVRAVVEYLEAGKLEEAKRVCIWDHDKISNYPELVEFVKTKLFADGEEHPWSVLERMQQRD